MAACERDLLVETIVHIEDENEGAAASVEAVACRLGLAVSTVFRKLKKHGILRPRKRDYVMTR